MTAAADRVLWTALDAAEAAQGGLHGQWQATGVSIDTRTLEPGDLFIALKGPTFDGHDFVGEAMAKGAAAAVVDADHAFDDTMPRLVVGDTMSALESLGRAARRRTHARIAAITGSVGKTGTKEALSLALKAQGSVAATRGNLNNHWGLPLSLARMPLQTDYGVYEIGMSSPGEILPLSEMAAPHVAIITAIAEVHSEFFRSIDDIADAKAEIFAGVETDGTAVLNRDDAQFERLLTKSREAGVRNILTFGEHVDADYRLADCRLLDDGSDVSMTYPGGRLTYRVGIAGRHWAANSLAVLAAVSAMGGNVDAAARSLSGMQALAGRGERRTVALDGGSFTVIDESYNASPASMAAAINVLGTCDVSAGGRRIAVLGDMLELGDRSEHLHADLAQVLAEQSIDLVFTAGQHMSALWEALPAALRGGHASVAQNLTPLVIAAVQSNDVVMVKGSLGSRMAPIVAALCELDAVHATEPRRTVNGE